MTSRCIRYHSSMHRYRRDLIEVRYIQKQRFKSVLSLVENNINKALEYNVVYLQGSVSAMLTFGDPGRIRLSILERKGDSESRPRNIFEVRSFNLFC